VLNKNKIDALITLGGDDTQSISLALSLERWDWPEYLASLCLISVCLATLCLIPREPSIDAHLKQRVFNGLNRPYPARLCLKQQRLFQSLNPFHIGKLPDEFLPSGWTLSYTN
jgi:hypothetical protein